MATPVNSRAFQSAEVWPTPVIGPNDVIRVFTLDSITAAGASSEKQRILNEVEEIVAMAVTVPGNEVVPYYRGRLRLEIGGVEYIEDGTEVALLQAPLSPWFPVAFPVGNGTVIKTKYTDFNHPSVLSSFAAYTPKVSLLCRKRNDIV